MSKKRVQADLSAFVVHSKKNKIDAAEKAILTGQEKFEDLIHPSWRKHLSAELNAEYFKKLESFVSLRRKSHDVFPPPEDVFSWTHYCTFDNVKVVILGQDPYHDNQQAHGLCFSVKKGIGKPPSLKNMFKELKNEYTKFAEPNHGDLSGWAKQGVLLLNAVLTVDTHKANSHQNKGWEKFTDAAIKAVNDKHKDVVFLLWGKPAQKKAAFVDKNKHKILESVHPSPLSASRGVFGCDHFKKANEFLKEKGKREIKWDDL